MSTVLVCWAHESDIDTIILAGAFGSYIDPASAVTIGLLPPLPLDRIHQIGNAAGSGAKRLLLNEGERAPPHDLW